MKKLLIMGAFFCSLFAVSNVNAGGWGYGFNNNGGCGDCGCAAPCNTCNTSCNTSCDCAAPCDSKTGDCVCKYVHYQPYYYNVTRCYTEEIPCQRTCCQYVPQYYQVPCVRYVPEYYSVTRCRYVPQYYQVPYSTYRTRTYCEPHVNYTPVYYWKRECGCASTPCC